MLPELEFYANHNLDFEHTDFAELEYKVISGLRKIAVPKEILHIVYDSLLAQFPGTDLSKFTGIQDWSPISDNFRPNVPKIHIVVFGPMGIRFIVTPQHIILPAIIYDRVQWYSPENKGEVQIIRAYYSMLINLFGGDHALYVDDKIIYKYYPSTDKFDKTALTSFEQTLITRYGPSKKTLFDYAHGKYPKYYIDRFSDIK